jgi:hypothetical protein
MRNFFLLSLMIMFSLFYSAQGSEPIEECGTGQVLKKIQLRSKLGLTLKTNKEEYQVYEPITITFIWTNVSNQDIIASDRELCIYSLDIRGDSGIQYKIMLFDERINHPPEEIVLKPGQVYQYKRDISEDIKRGPPELSIQRKYKDSNLNRFFMPGEYSIAACGQDYYTNPVNTVKIIIKMGDGFRQANNRLKETGDDSGKLPKICGKDSGGTEPFGIFACENSEGKKVYVQSFACEDCAGYYFDINENFITHCHVDMYVGEDSKECKELEKYKCDSKNLIYKCGM